MRTRLFKSSVSGGVHANVPVLGTPRASTESNEAPPLVDHRMFTESTPAGSAAAHVMFCATPPVHASPPLGALSASVGPAMSGVAFHMPRPCVAMKTALFVVSSANWYTGTAGRPELAWSHVAPPVVDTYTP